VSSHVVRWPQLAAHVEAVRSARGLSMREVARQTGLSASGLTKLRQGGKLSADSVASLVAWMNPASMPSWITPSPSSSQEGGTDG
jgi:transcriptional regulator with XRE-family HTH domain